MGGRWAALAIIFISFLQFTLNWFCIVPAFGGLLGDLQIGPAQLGGIVGMFIAGYGIAHIPGGWIAERYGMRNAMLLGIAVETLGAALSAWAPSYGLLLGARFVAGVGGSIYLGSALGLTAAWFRGRELATANGLIGGVAFTVGAVIGLFGWSRVVGPLGWRDGLLAGAVVGLLTVVLLAVAFPTPPSAVGEVIEGEHLGRDSLRRIFGSPTLWLMGFALLGGYGSYFSAAQLMPAYAQATFNLDAGTAEAIGAILLVAGIPGSFLGGWLTDRVLGAIPTLVLSMVIEGIMFLVVPVLGLVGVEIAAAVVGMMGISAFVPFVTIPGQKGSGFHISDVPTAVGLMLTIAAVGGAVVPPLFTRIAADHGFASAWIFQGVISIAFACLALLLRQRRAEPLPAALRVGE